MASSFLSPPNSYSLSDNVIGGVVQCVGRFGVNSDNTNRAALQYTKPTVTLSHYGPNAVQPPRSEPASIGHKRLPRHDPIAEMVSKSTAYNRSSYATEEEPQPPTGRKIKVSASRRERCRINQARYRQRQRQHEEELDQSIRQVQEEIQDLETQRQDILRCAPTNGSVWVVATEYCRLFRYGFMPPMMVPESKSASMLSKINKSQEPPALKQANVQLEFLKGSMAEDVTDGVVCGAEALLENWRLFSLYHDDVHYQLQRLEQKGEDSLSAATKTSVTITKNTLHHVYPHLDVEHSALLIAAKLLGQRLVMRGTVHFHWDNATGRVVRVESKMDALAPMLRLLGSLEDVAVVFERALMTPEGRLSATQNFSDNN